MPGPTPICPRCGYDQSGIIATWAESCPLDGVCSECGLEILWAEVLSPNYAPPAWSYEHARRLGVVSLAATLGRALSPPVFWGSLRLTHPVVVPRLVALIVLVIVMGHMAAAGAGAAAAYRVAANAPPLAMRVWLPGTGAQGRPRFVTRPAPAGPSPWESAIRGAIWPYGADRLWQLVPRSMVRRGAVVADAGIELLVFVAAIPPGFLILGDTLRKCKVLKRHLLRGAAYSLTGPLLVWCAGSVVAAAGGFVPWRLGFALGVGWLILYWMSFVKTYLRLTHAGWVTLAMLTIAGLLTTIVATLNYTRHLGWQ